MIGEKLERRCKDKEVGAALIASQVGILDAVQEMERLMQVDRIRSYHPWEEESNDIKNSAWQRASNLYALTSKKYGAKYQVEFLSILSMSDKERRICDRIAQIAGTIQEDMNRRFGPILGGEIETIPTKVRNHLRGEWKKIARRKTIFENHQEEIREQIHPEERKPGEKQVVRIDYYHAYHIAKKRWGKKGQIFLDKLSQGATVTNASQEAGVTRQMGHRYLKELKRALSPKKSSS